MPPVVVAINTALAAAASYVVTSAAVLNFILAYGVQTILIASSIAYSAAQQRKLKKALGGAGAGGIDQGRTLMTRDPIAPRRIIYGQCLVSGPITYFATFGSNNEYLYLNIKLADHECEELGDVYFNDELVPLASEAPSSGRYVGFARVKKFTGIAAGERDTDLESESGGEWTSSHLGKGVARLHVRLKYSADIFPNGLPLIKCLVKGKKVYDPRTTTTAWSANAALCVGDYLMDARFGKGIALARLRDAEWQEAANICDEDVTLDDLSTEKRYTCNGTVNTDQDPGDILLDLTGSMAGHVSDPGGLWTIRAGAWRTPALSLGDGDIVGAVSIVPRQSRQDTYNGVRGTFIGAINQWAPADFPAIKNDTYMGWDGGVRLWKDVAYNFTTSPATAQRLAKIDLEVGRQQIIVTADFTLKALQAQPGDVISLTRPRMGWTSKPFEVLESGLKLINPEKDPALAVGLVLRETAEGVWDWNDGEETTVDLAPNTTLYNPRTVAALTGLTLNSASHTVTQPDGTIIPKVRVTWTAPSDQQILSGGHVEIEYRINGTTTWLPWADNIDGSLTEDFITDVKSGLGYDVRARFRNVKGVRGGYGTVTNHVVAGDSTAPSTPSGLSATSTLESITLDWADNTEADFSHYEVWRHTADSSGAATKIADARVSRFVDTFPAASTTYYYWLKAIDRSGNASAFTSSVNSSRTEQAGGGGGYSLTINFHPSGGGFINGVSKAGGTQVVTGLNPGAWVEIEANDPVGTDNFSAWSGAAASTGQLESSLGTNPNRILMGGNLELTADYV